MTLRTIFVGTHMKLGAFSIASLLWLIIAAQAKTIPKEVWGKWVVSRVLPTTTIACWGDSEAKTLIGTEIEYSPDLFRWNNVITRRPTALIQVVSAERFRDDNLSCPSRKWSDPPLR